MTVLTSKVRSIYLVVPEVFDFSRYDLIEHVYVDGHTCAERALCIASHCSLSQKILLLSYL